ncbi:MAG: DUF3526 domain-containing protein [Steroidobacteraceae bacterium]
MIATVLRKEFLAVLRDGRVLTGAAALLALGIIALASGAARYSALAGERAAAQALVAEQWTQQGEKNPHSAAHYGVYAFRPALPLSFFDPGVVSFEGVAIWLEAHKRNFATGRPADDMTPLARFGELSLSFVFQALVPLALILMAYAAFSRERETGTLRLLLATGVTPGQLFIGKFLGIFAAAVVLLAPIVLLALLALALAGGTVWLPAALLLLAVYLLYGVVLLLFALVVSARASSSQMALLILLAFWATTTFVVPRLAADLGRVLAPTPTRAAFMQGVEEGINGGLGGLPPAARIAARRDALLKIYKVERQEDLPINFQGVVFGIQDEISNAAYDQEFATLNAAIDSQVDILEAASILSPRAALALVSQELAGTSLAHQRHFERAAEDFRRELMALLNRDITVNSKAGDTGYRAGADLWRTTGEFRYQPESLHASLARSGAPLMVLVLWLLATVLAVAMTTRRLQVLSQ